MGAFSVWHFLILLAIVVLVFGGSRVSGLLAEAGRGIRAFREALGGDGDAGR